MSRKQVTVKRTFARDERGKFKKKVSVQPQPVVEAKVLEKKEPKVVKATDLFSLLKKGESLYVKALVSDVKEIRHADREYIIQSTFHLSSPELMISSAIDYARNGIFINAIALDGNPRNFYVTNDFEFLLIDEEIPEHKEYIAAYGKMRLSNLYRSLAHDFSIGSDPEIFVENKEGGLIPAFLFLPGKDEPAYTSSSERNFSVYGGMPMYWDGFQAEFTTQANRCLGHHGDSIAAGMRGIYDAAIKKFPEARLSIQSVFHIDPEVLMTAEDEHVAFGCMPSFNAYGLKVNMPPARDVPFRSAGGHIHFGVGKMNHKAAEPMVKALDAILGVACVSLFAEFDDPNRRRLYGLPGEYRLPPHGLEYRPLSNAWLAHPMIMNLVIDLARKCVIFGKDGWMKHWNATEEETLSCIIKCDVEKAHTIMDRNKDIFKSLLKASHQGAANASLDMLFNVFYNGMQTAVKDPTDFVSNWRLKTGWTPHRGAIGEPNVASFIRSRVNDPTHRV